VIRATAVLLACAASLACSKNGEAGSCFRDAENLCVEHTKEQGAAGKKVCVGRWTTGEGTCPTANRLGTCTRRDGAEIYLSGPPNGYTAVSAKSKCEFGGGSFRGTSP
jgi:hypothetical protein